MGTIVTRGEVFRAVVRIGGHKPQTKTFPTKREAGLWITATEAALQSAPRISRGTTLGWIFAKAEIADAKKTYLLTTPWKGLAAEIGEVDVKDCTAKWWMDLVLSWDTSPHSRLTKLQNIRGALRYAEDMHEIKIDWEALRLATSRLTRLKIIKKGKGRTRRASDEEIAVLKTAAAVYDTKFPYADIMDFAIITCMRRGEIFRAKWTDVNMVKGQPMLMIYDRKHPKEKIGNDQNIPLLGKAHAIIKRQPKTSEYIFPFIGNSFGNSFKRLIKRAGIAYLHFHDLRHEGISRMFEAGFGIAEVCNVSGHKSWSALKIYTNIDGADMHNGPLAKRAA